MNKNIWYVKFKIKKYLSLDNVQDIIKQIDKIICCEEKIFGTTVKINITESDDLNYDYICETNIICSKKEIIKYFNHKFVQAQNLIKSNYVEYGFDWFIDYSLKQF